MRPYRLPYRTRPDPAQLDPTGDKQGRFDMSIRLSIRLTLSAAGEKGGAGKFAPIAETTFRNRFRLIRSHLSPPSHRAII